MEIATLLLCLAFGLGIVLALALFTTFVLRGK
jgi:hypothetical protein